MADEGHAESITIKVKDSTGEEMQFKVKKTTRMEKIFEAYACTYLTPTINCFLLNLCLSSARRGISANALRFMLDGEKIGADQTAKMLEVPPSPVYYSFITIISIYVARRQRPDRR